jgi:hypothetical protein
MINQNKTLVKHIWLDLATISMIEVCENNLKILINVPMSFDYDENFTKSDAELILTKWQQI